MALPSISSALHNPKAFCQLAMSKLSDTADAFLRTVKAVIGHNFIHDSLHSLKELVMPALKERNLSSMASVSPKLITADYDDCDRPLVLRFSEFDTKGNLIDQTIPVHRIKRRFHI